MKIKIEINKRIIENAKQLSEENEFLNQKSNKVVREILMLSSLQQHFLGSFFVLTGKS